MTNLAITADARTVSGADFFEQINPGYRERNADRLRQSIELVARLIEVGASTYGYGPWYIEEAMKLIAERGSLVEVEQKELPGGRYRVAA